MPSEGLLYRIFLWGLIFVLFVVHLGVMKFSTHCVMVSKRAQIWTGDVLLWLFFCYLCPIDSVLDTQCPLSQAVPRVMVEEVNRKV